MPGLISGYQICTTMGA